MKGFTSILSFPSVVVGNLLLSLLSFRGPHTSGNPESRNKKGKGLYKQTGSRVHARDDGNNNHYNGNNGSRNPADRQTLWDDGLTTSGHTANTFHTATAGFTLIELLVVVLIIGILAAVALPQYEKAVTKSRVSTVLPWFTALKRGQELFILNGGTSACLDLMEFADLSGLSYTYSRLIETSRRLYCDSQIRVSPDLLFYSVNGGVNVSYKGMHLYMVLNPTSAKSLNAPVGTVFCMGQDKCAKIGGAEYQICHYGSSQTPCYKLPN